MREKGRAHPFLAILLIIVGLIAVDKMVEKGVFERPVSAGEYARSVEDGARETIPYFDSRYFLTSVKPEVLDALTQMYSAAEDFKSGCEFSSKLTKEDFQVCFEVLRYECPELFQLDFSEGLEYTYNSTTGDVMSVDLSYIMSREDYLGARERCEELIDDFALKTQDWPAEERERYVFDYIVENCRYDTKSLYCATAYGALINGRAKCDGASAGMKWALEAMGFRCVTVAAEIPGETVGHAWNAVELDGEWYRLDVTQSLMGMRDEREVDETLYYAFNISDDLTRKEYIVSDTLAKAAPIPECRSMDRSFYALTGGLVRRGEDWEARVRRELDVIAGDGGSVTLQFEDAGEYDAFCKAAADIVRETLDGRSEPVKIYYATTSDYSIFYAEARRQ